MAAHKHYSGFALNTEALERHMVVDHGFNEGDLSDETVVAQHTALHPEISGTDTGDSPDLVALMKQIVDLQSAVDDLVLDSLLNG